MSSEQVATNPSSSAATSTYPEFSARGEKITTLSNMLKAMHLGKKKEAQLSNIVILDEGLSVTTSKAKSLVSRCSLRKGYFSQYRLMEEMLSLCVDIGTLIQVLTIFGSDTNQIEYHFEYKKSNDFLHIFLSHPQEQSVTQCELFTFNEAVEIPNLRWSDYRIINRLSANTPFLKDVFNEIDALAKDEEIVYFYVKKGNENEDIENNIGLSNIVLDEENEEKKIMDDDINCMNDINMDNNKIIKSSISIGVTSDTLQFEGVIPMTDETCKAFEFKETKKYQYRLSLLRPALRAVAKSDIVRICFNEQGTLQIQHVFNDMEGHGWVDFTLLPQDNDFIDDNDD